MFRLLSLLIVLFSLPRIPGCDDEQADAPNALPPGGKQVQEDLLAWEQLAKRSPDNRYLPSAYRRARTHREQRRDIRDFREYRDTRTAVHWEVASPDLHRRYFQAKLGDLTQRIEVLELIDQRLSQRIQPSRDEQMRLTALHDELRSLSVAKARAEERLAQPPRGYRLPKRLAVGESPPDTVVCVVDSYGWVRCELLATLTDTLMTGRWDGPEWVTERLDETGAWDFLHQLDLLDAAWEVDLGHNTRVACPDGSWHVADTYGPGADSPYRPDLPAHEEMLAMVHVCQHAVRTQFDVKASHVRGSAAGLGGDDTGWARHTVTLIDREIAACQEPTDPITTITPLDADTGDVAVAELLTWLRVDLLSAAKLADADARRRAKLRAQALSAYAKVLWLAREEQVARVKVETLDAAAQSLELSVLAPGSGKSTPQLDARKSAKSWKKKLLSRPPAEAAEVADAGTAEPEVPPAQRVDEAWAQAKQARQAHAVAKQQLAGAEQEARLAWAELAIPPVEPGAPLRATLVDYCETRRQAWTSFRAQCDARDGWERPGDLCHDLLRRRRSCFDPTRSRRRVTPSTRCEAGLWPDAEAAREACLLAAKHRSDAEGVDTRCRYLAAREAAALPRLPAPCIDPMERPLDPKPCVVPKSGKAPSAAKRGSRDDEAFVLGVLRRQGPRVYDGLNLGGLGRPVDSESPARE